MLSPAFKKELKQPAQLLNVTWWTFTASIPIYALVAYLLGRSLTAPSTSIQPVLLPILVVAAVGSLTFSFVFRQHAFGDAALARALGSGSAASKEDLQRLEQDLLNLMPYIQTRMIVVWAAVEAVAIYGLLLVFLRFDPLTALPFGVVALLGILYNRPRPEEILERAARLARRG
jgi:F0F1-type ATP synthase membrane subunit c/vacuolar-type H+-ATPase subunit K